jgi:cytidyltransferase-like protein
MTEPKTLGKWKKLIFSSNQASKIRKQVEGKNIVFCSGCFDVLQPGHSIFFEQCKRKGEVVVVGLGRDSTISTLKGSGRPINSEYNRAYLLASFKDVDYVIFNDAEIVSGKIDFSAVIRKLRPNVFVLNDDDSGIAEKQKLCNELGIKLILVKREAPDFLEPTSTTKIIKKMFG